MATLGIELCDAAFHAATCHEQELHPLPIPEAGSHGDWAAFACYDGDRFLFGRPAEDEWFVHPRRVNHSFWARLAHEPSPIGPAGRPAAYSELAYHFLRDFSQRIAAGTAAGRIVLAVPGAYLKDTATEEERIGLLLGMAGDLRLSLAGIVDLAGAALCNPRAPGFNAALPVVVVDLHLEGADLTLLGTDERLERKDFIHLPQSGHAQLLKHLTGTLGNRFLRHTAFDILEDGRIEQSFYRQTKNFLLSGAPEHRFQINTSNRTYEMLAKREQLVADAQAFVATLVQGLQTFLRNSPHAAEPCTVALTDRAAGLPGLEARLHSAGFHRLLRLPPGAAAGGAARLGESTLTIAADLAEVPVVVSFPLALARRQTAPWEARLQKLRLPGPPRPAPTHLIFEGVGYPLDPERGLTIGLAGTGADLVLPDAFTAASDCTIPLEPLDGHFWFVDLTVQRTHGVTATAPPARTVIDSGDRLTIRCGAAAVELVFAYCGTGARSRPPR
jgi:hypothetical protein